jgi:hypothetical protein
VKFVKSGGIVKNKRVVIGDSQDCYFSGSASCNDH